VNDSPRHERREIDLGELDRSIGDNVGRILTSAPRDYEDAQQ
jgi:hypothetical protein